MIASLLLLQAVWIAPHDPNCCGCGEDSELPHHPLIVSEWGEAESGLSMRVLTDSTRIELGARIITKIEFRFDPSGLESPPSVLDSRGALYGSSGYRLRFAPSNVHESHSGAYERDVHFDYSPGGFVGPFCFALCDLGRTDRWAGFFLLSEEGEQVPPGRYAMSVRYENSGGPMVDRSTPWQINPERCWAPPESIWVGAIESAPIGVEVVDRPPSTRTTEFPTRIELESHGDRYLSIWEDSTSTCTETFQIRPGYHAGMRIDDAIYVEDAEAIDGFWEEDPEELSRGANCNPFARWTSGARGISLDLGHGGLPGIAFESIADLLELGTQYRFRRKYVVFESSVAGSRHSAPEKGDYRVLVEHVVDTPWTMDSLRREVGAPTSPRE